MPKKIRVVIFVLTTILLSISFAQTQLLNESFTSATFPPTGWYVTTYSGGDDEDWYRYTNNYYTTPACTRIRTDADTRNNDWLITKRIGPIRALDSVIFYARRDSDNETLYVRVSTNSTQTDTGQYAILSKVPITSTSWTRFARSLSAYGGEDSIYIAFWYREDDRDEVRLDDIIVNSYIYYTLDISTVGSGSVTKNPNQDSFIAGTNVQLTAYPSSGWIFCHWSDDTNSTNNPITVIMNNDKNITATFCVPETSLYESFEGTAFPPAGWDTMNAAGDKKWYRTSQRAYTGSYSAVLPNQPSGAGIDWLFTPRIGPIDSSDVFSFYAMQLMNIYAESVYIRVSTNATRRDTSQYSLLGLVIINTATNVWTQHTFSLSAYAGQQIYLAFYNKSGYPQDSVFIDGVMVEGCRPITLDTFLLTVNNGGHSTVSGGGYYTSGATAYATVTDSIVTSGTTRYVFAGWTGDATGTKKTSNGITMNAPKTATASWTTQFYLTVNNGGHSTTGGTGWYDSSATAYATITDSIVAGSAGVQYVFKQWTIDATGTKKTSDGIFMGAPKTATASWTTQFYLTLVTNPPGITTPTGAGWCDKNSNAPISTPSSVNVPPSYSFTKWTTTDMTEIADSLSVSTTVYMDTAKTVTANYAQPEAIRDVGVDSILTPGDTVVTCTPFNPVIRVSNNSSPSMTETCTLRVKIWRFRVKYDSVCHISVNPLDSVVAYDTSLVITINTGLTNITMPPWHPIWADLYWLSSPTYHRITASVHMTYDANPANDKKSKKFIVKARKYDLQLNYMGLLRGKILAPDTITTGVAYNSFSVVSNSPSGPSAPFRSWFKVIRMKTNLTVYSQYLDRTLAPRTYLCIYYSSGWVANDTGLYKAVSYIETRPGLDSVVDNNRIERYYYAAHSSGSGPMGEVSTLPQTFGLMQNSPNPFRSVTTIRWQIPSESRVTISIYDATGRNIKTLANSTFVPGYYNTTWNCTDDRNQKVSAGIYFYEMRANNYIARHKMVITN